MSGYEVYWGKTLEWAKENKKNHGVFSTYHDARQSINVWWEQNEFEPRYVRWWTKEHVTTLDYGNHNFFYFIEETVIS